MRLFASDRLLVWLPAMAIAVAVLPSAGASVTGTMSLEWDPVPGAQGYRIYWGFSPGEYTNSLDVGLSTSGTLTLPDDCTDHYVAVKAYNLVGESEVYSNEVSGWATPELEPEDSPVFMQGEQHSVLVSGANFDPAMQMVFDAFDVEGQPLVRVDSLNVVSCNQLQALVTVEPTASGSRAMEVGTHAYEIRNPDGVAGSGTYEVLLNPVRLDINQSDSSTANHLDGLDLVWLAYAYGAEEGDARFNANADLSGDGFVDGDDLAFLASEYGSCWDGSDWTVEACP